MPPDTLYRHQQALDPSALTIVTGAGHALAAAIADCHAVGKNPDTDPAVILLARHLGRIADAVASHDDVLRRRCARTIAIIRGQRTPSARIRVKEQHQPDVPRIAA